MSNVAGLMNKLLYYYRALLCVHVIAVHTSTIDMQAVCRSPHPYPM